MLATSDREGADWLFKELQAHQVPLLILSAGIGDVIELVIRHKHTFYDNMKIVSNYMDFDSQVQCAHSVGTSPWRCACIAVSLTTSALIYI